MAATTPTFKPNREPTGHQCRPPTLSAHTQTDGRASRVTNGGFAVRAHRMSRRREAVRDGSQRAGVGHLDRPFPQVCVIAGGRRRARAVQVDEQDRRAS